MNSILAKFKDRNIEEESNKCLAEVYVDGPTFDIDLISSDQKIVSAHKFVVCMFSDYLKEYLREFKPLGKACISLPEISYFVLKHVIDLFYNAQIIISAEVKPRLVNALTFLKVAGIVFLNPDKQLMQSAEEVQSTENEQPTQVEEKKKPIKSVTNVSRSLIDETPSKSAKSALPANDRKLSNSSTESDFDSHCDSDPPQKRPRTQPIDIQRLSRIGSISITKAKANASIATSMPLSLSDLSIKPVLKTTPKKVLVPVDPNEIFKVEIETEQQPKSNDDLQATSPEHLASPLNQEVIIDEDVEMEEISRA